MNFLDSAVSSKFFQQFTIDEPTFEKGNKTKNKKRLKKKLQSFRFMVSNGE